MLVFRCLQGVGAALVLSCGAALVTSLYGEERRSRALGIYTMMLALGLMLGPLLGGALTAAWDWPAVFWYRIPIAIAALLLLRGMPASPQRQASDRFDILGGAALVLGLVDDAADAQPSARVFRRLVRTALRRSFCRFRFSRVPGSKTDHCRRSSQTAGFRAAQSRQRAGQSRRLLDLAAGALFPRARARLWPDRERRHPGGSGGGSRAGRADRRPSRRTTHLGRAAGDHGCRRRRRRPAVDRHVDGANPHSAADRRARLARRRQRPVPARLFGYRHRSATAAGPRRCRQSCAADANAGYCDRRVDRADGVRNPEHRARTSSRPSSRPFSLRPCWHLSPRSCWRYQHVSVKQRRAARTRPAQRRATWPSPSRPAIRAGKGHCSP